MYEHVHACTQNNILQMVQAATQGKVHLLNVLSWRRKKKEIQKTLFPHTKCELTNCCFYWNCCFYLKATCLGELPT
jgi:hypothetical protein